MIAVCTSAVLVPALARAEPWLKFDPGNLRIAFEPGASYLHANGTTTWAYRGGGGNISLNLTDRFGVTGFFRQESNVARDPDQTQRIWGIGGKADIDVLWLTPFLELGLASVYLKPTSGAPYGPTLDVFLGAGVDVSFTRWLFGGIVFRYFAVGGTDVWSNPAYSTINARLGFIIGGK
jgi:hypothetical protein